MEKETIKKSQTDNPEDRKSRKEMKSHRCKHHYQNTRDRTSGIDDTLENIDITIKENAKCKSS